MSQMEMNEGYAGPRRPGPDRPLPARRPAGRVAPRLDDDALDAHLERRRGRRAEAALRPGPPGRRTSSGWARARSSGARRAIRGARGAARRRPRRLALRRARSTSCPRSARRSPRGLATSPTPRTSIGSSPGTRSARRRAPGSSTSPRAAAPRTSQLGKTLGLPVIAPLDESGDLHRRVRVAHRPRRPRRHRADRRATSSHGGRFYRLETYHPPLPALLAVRHAARLPARRRVVHQHGQVYDRPRDELTPAEIERACATRSWRSSTRSAGSRASATTGSSTGSTTCTTG